MASNLNFTLLPISAPITFHEPRSGDKPNAKRPLHAVPTQYFSCRVMPAIKMCCGCEGASSSKPTTPARQLLLAGKALPGGGKSKNNLWKTDGAMLAVREKCGSACQRGGIKLFSLSRGSITSHIDRAHAPDGHATVSFI